VVGVSAVTARAVLRRWNARGPAELPDGRAGNRGAAALTDSQRAELFAALKRRPPDGGLWTGPKVAGYVRDRWGLAVWPQTGWRWLRDLGFTLQVPRPAHPKGERSNSLSPPDGLVKMWLRALVKGCPSG
jgi:transposase